MTLKINTDTEFTDYQNFKKLLGTMAFYDYPNLRTGFITGFIFENNEVLCKDKRNPPNAVRRIWEHY